MIISNSVTAFAPATVANVGCGFDIMGFAVRGLGDFVTVEAVNNLQEHTMIRKGEFGLLTPPEMERNTAGVAILSYLESTGNSNLRLKVTLDKRMPLGSGMGSSASSSAAAVFAVNRLLGDLLPVKELVPFAMEGERVASGTAHADNVAPSLLGGFILIRSYTPLDIIEIKCPDDIFCTVVHPHIEVKTSDARKVLKREIPMSDVIKQSANTAAFMTGILRSDYELIGRSLDDFLAEPKRIKLIPGFEMVKEEALRAGAIGCGISGSGPSVFALFRGERNGAVIGSAMKNAFMSAGLDSEFLISSLNEPGAIIINQSV